MIAQLLHKACTARVGETLERLVHSGERAYSTLLIKDKKKLLRIRNLLELDMGNLSNGGLQWDIWSTQYLIKSQEISEIQSAGDCTDTIWPLMLRRSDAREAERP